MPDHYSKHPDIDNEYTFIDTETGYLVRVYQKPGRADNANEAIIVAHNPDDADYLAQLIRVHGVDGRELRAAYRLGGISLVRRELARSERGESSRINVVPRTSREELTPEQEDQALERLTGIKVRPTASVETEEEEGPVKPKRTGAGGDFPIDDPRAPPPDIYLAPGHVWEFDRESARWVQVRADSFQFGDALVGDTTSATADQLIEFQRRQAELRRDHELFQSGLNREEGAIGQEYDLQSALFGDALDRRSVFGANQADLFNRLTSDPLTLFLTARLNQYGVDIPRYAAQFFGDTNFGTGQQFGQTAGYGPLFSEAGLATLPESIQALLSPLPTSAPGSPTEPATAMSAEEQLASSVLGAALPGAVDPIAQAVALQGLSANQAYRQYTSPTQGLDQFQVADAGLRGYSQDALRRARSGARPAGAGFQQPIQYRRRV